MFRSLSGDGQSSAAGRGGSSPGLHSQESSWIGLLSRPAVSFLQRYLPGRPRAPARADPGAGWIHGDLKTSFVDEEREFLRQLDDMMPLTQHAAPHLTYLRCQHDGAAGLLEPSGGSTLPWLTADSLREIGIQSAEDMDLNLCQQTQIGYLSSVRTFFSQVLLSSVSSQEVRPSTGGADWEPGKTGRTWWGSLWGGEGGSQRGLLSDLSWAEDRTATGTLCPQQLKVPETTAVFVRSGRDRSPGEHTGETHHKEQLDNNGGLHTVQNTEGSTPDQLSISDHLSRSGAAACSEAALLTPDQDNGYSSLEEEHFQVNVVKDPGEEDQEAADNTPMEDQEEDQEAAPQIPDPQEAPQCQNKAIAFIMGCPCSDDDSSQSDGESTDDDDDDDGFDSEGSSESDSTDEDDEEEDEDSDSEADSEADRLWSSLCQSVDPYNPRNFTARLHTAPRTVPGSTPPSSTQSTPASSPDLTPAPLTSSSPPSGPDSWDDSTSASEVDEAESLRLLSSFSCSSDPYSPFNFQAPLRTRGPVEAGPRTRTRTKKVSQTPTRSPRHTAASPPEYRREEAEERLDSGFSEPSTSSQSCCSAKKVGPRLTPPRRSRIS